MQKLSVLSSSVLKKVQSILSATRTGLKNNSSLTPYPVLDFVYAITYQEFIKPPKKEEEKEEEKKSKLLEPRATYDDLCRVLPEPRKSRAHLREEALVSGDARGPALAAFCLSLLEFLFKNNSFQGRNEEDLQRLDPFVQILTHCLSSKNNSVNILAMKNMSYLSIFPLPAWQTRFRFALFYFISFLFLSSPF